MTRSPKLPAPREVDIVAAFRQLLYYTCPQAHWIAVPNGARRSAWEARNAKREGMATGFPDGAVIWPGGGIAFLEFKTGSNKPSEQQAEWLLRLNQYGFPCAVVRSADQAVDFLRQCGAPIRERAA